MIHKMAPVNNFATWRGISGFLWTWLYAMVWVKVAPDNPIVSVPASVTKPLVHSSDEYTSKTKALPHFLRVECGTYRKKDDHLELVTTRSAWRRLPYRRSLLRKDGGRNLLGSLLVLIHSPNSRRRCFRFENSNVSIVRLWLVNCEGKF